jgi:hypothetical protein
MLCAELLYVTAGIFMSIEFLLYNIRYSATEPTYCTQMKELYFTDRTLHTFTNVRVRIVLPSFVLKYLKCTRNNSDCVQSQGSSNNATLDTPLFWPSIQKDCNQRCAGSGSFHDQAKIVRKNFDFYCFVTSL